MNKKRAQAWGFDLVAGLTIFVIGIFSFYLFSLNYNAGGDSTLDQLDYQAEIIGDALLSEGYPNYWSYPNFTGGKLQQIGLLSEGKINQTKLDLFYNISTLHYDQTKGILNLEDEFWVNFTDRITIEGDPVDGVGSPFNANKKNIIKKTRIVSYNDKVTTVNIFVWN